MDQSAWYGTHHKKVPLVFTLFIKSYLEIFKTIECTLVRKSDLKRESGDYSTPLSSLRASSQGRDGGGGRGGGGERVK